MKIIAIICYVVAGLLAYFFLDGQYYLIFQLKNWSVPDGLIGKIVLILPIFATIGLIKSANKRMDEQEEEEENK